MLTPRSLVGEYEYSEGTYYPLSSRAKEVC